MRSEFDVADESQAGETYSPETVELMRSELARMEQELSSRDSRIEELTAMLEGHPAAGQTAGEGAPDTLALVARLEQLLDELDRKDQREASLQELLRLAEDAGRAEREERAQIEAWLSEIEQRVGEREAEWQAANDALRHRIDELTSERDRAEHAVAGASTSTGASDASIELVSQLRQQISQLEQKLEEAEKEKEELKSRQPADDSSHAAALREALDKSMREERLHLAHERAELARMRNELEHEKRGFERRPDEAEQRVMALRDHLREIHEKERAEQLLVQNDRSLSGRIARLWKRLDGSA
jgi:DNA repair exonuclease SbcCD ATPase subunit